MTILMPVLGIAIGAGLGSDHGIVWAIAGGLTGGVMGLEKRARWALNSMISTAHFQIRADKTVSTPLPVPVRSSQCLQPFLQSQLPEISEYTNIRPSVRA